MTETELRRRGNMGWPVWKGEGKGKREWVDSISQLEFFSLRTSRGRLPNSGTIFFHVVYHISSPWESDENEEGGRGKGEEQRRTRITP